MDSKPDYTRRGFMAGLGTVGTTIGMGSVISNHSDTDPASIGGQWLADTALDEVATAVTISQKTLVAVGNRLPGGSIENPTTSSHSEQDFFVFQIDMSTGDGVVSRVTSPGDTGRGGLTITDVAMKGESTVVVGHQHRDDQVVGLRLGESMAVETTWRIDAGGLPERVRVYWQDNRLIHVWRWRYTQAFGTGIDVRSPDGTQIASQRVGDESWHCHSFAAGDTVYVTEESGTPELGVVEPETAGIDWQDELRSCHTMPTPSGEIGITSTDSSLSWHLERDDGTTKQEQFASNLEPHGYHIDMTNTADGGYLVASGIPVGSELAETHLLRVSSDGLDWHSQLATDDQHFTGQALATVGDDQWILVGSTGIDDLDAWVLSGTGPPNSLPEPTIVSSAAAERTATADDGPTMSPPQGTDSTSPHPTPNEPATSTSPATAETLDSTSPSAVSTTETSTISGQSGDLLSFGGVVGLAGLLVGSARYVQRKRRKQE